jgi:pimeloyl-ACP methyl ester carboxylesterase
MNAKKRSLISGSYRYSSSIDDISNLFAKYCYDCRKNALPIVILMHGWNQDSTVFTSDIMEDMAEYGFFVCALGMRGRDGASGSPNGSGTELFDIIDAVEYLKANFANYVDPNNLNISGYSGGGGNVLGLAAKFPDYFNVLVSHFGISDYGYDAESSWWYRSPHYQKTLEQFIGHTPATNLYPYYSRAHQYGIGKNLSGSFLFMFHDREDNNVQAVQSEMVSNQMNFNDRKNYLLSITNAADTPRWIHEIPYADQPVKWTREIWGPAILNRSYPQWMVSEKGEMLVQGYLITKRFEIWLGDGMHHVSKLSYDAFNATYTVTPLTGEVTVTIKQGGKMTAKTISTSTTIVVS